MKKSEFESKYHWVEYIEPMDLRECGRKINRLLAGAGPSMDVNKCWRMPGGKINSITRQKYIRMMVGPGRGVLKPWKCRGCLNPAHYARVERLPPQKDKIKRKGPSEKWLREHEEYRREMRELRKKIESERKTAGISTQEGLAEE